jgi:hypothetical protein
VGELAEPSFLTPTTLVCPEKTKSGRFTRHKRVGPDEQRVFLAIDLDVVVGVAEFGEYEGELNVATAAIYEHLGFHVAWIDEGGDPGGTTDGAESNSRRVLDTDRRE